MWGTKFSLDLDMANVNFPLNVQIGPTRGTSHCVFAVKENVHQGMSPCFITPHTCVNEEHTKVVSFQNN